MYFTLHHAQLEHALACQTNGDNDALRPLICAGLRCLMRQPAAYDACIAQDNPFLRELDTYLSRPALDAEDRFSLLECLIILVRAKALHAGAPITPEEISLQRHFEQSGEWRPDDGTLVSLWYWVLLPQLAGMLPAA